MLGMTQLPFYDLYQALKSLMFDCQCVFSRGSVDWSNCTVVKNRTPYDIKPTQSSSGVTKQSSNP